MLSAIAGSMIRAGGADDVQRGERQREAVRDRERRDDDREPPDGAAEQQQADQEQQMIGADQDVVDAGRHEPADDREAPWRVPAKYSNVVRPRSRIACVSALALVDVEKRLVLRIVREHHARDRQRCRAARQRVAERAAAATGDRRRPPRPTIAASARGRRRRSSSRRRQHRAIARDCCGDDRRIEQPLGRIDRSGRARDRRCARRACLRARPAGGADRDR